MKRKILILKTALDLFNSLGVSSVSTKRIAKELQISDGNLRYHYPTKEHLILALFQGMQEELQAYKSQMTNTAVSYNADFFTSFFLGSFDIQYQYRCLYLDQVHLKATMEAYANVYDTYVASWKQDFLELFNFLKENCILSAHFTDQQYEFLFHQIYMYSNSWLLFQAQEQKPVSWYVDICVSLFAPYWAD